MANYKILVVDDEEDLCEILKFNLEVEGYDVDTANSAEEALQMNLTDYNLLLLDVMMGEMNGFKMASLLRKNEKLKHIPIIFLTAKDSTELPLTKKEFEILSLLLSHPGQVFSREEILSKIWTDEVYVLDRTIDVNITRLRKKIGEYGKRIVTRLGYGYCFETA